MRTVPLAGLEHSPNLAKVSETTLEHSAPVPLDTGTKSLQRSRDALGNKPLERPISPNSTDMEARPPRSLKIATFAGLLCLGVPSVILGTWIHAFNLGTTQLERVELFTGYFPSPLQGRYTITLIGMAFCVLTVVLSSKSLALPGLPWKVLNILSLIAGCSLFLLDLFQLM
jgi:hypothetical protein